MAPIDPLVQRARSGDWVRHRAIIAELYLGQMMRLEDVKETMAKTHEFHAT